MLCIYNFNLPFIKYNRILGFSGFSMFYFSAPYTIQSALSTQSHESLIIAIACHCRSTSWFTPVFLFPSIIFSFSCKRTCFSLVFSIFCWQISFIWDFLPFSHSRTLPLRDTWTVILTPSQNSLFLLNKSREVDMDCCQWFSQWFSWTPSTVKFYAHNYNFLIYFG